MDRRGRRRESLEEVAFLGLTPGDDRFLRSPTGSPAADLRGLGVLVGPLLLQDLPDFLVMDCRGDLSDTARPLIAGAWVVPMS